jgi:hypothetical protein
LEDMSTWPTRPHAAHRAGGAWIPGEVAVELGCALGERVGLAGVPDFELDRLPQDEPVAVGLADEEVDPALADPVLPVHEPPAVDDALQERGEHQLRGGLAVVPGLGQDFPVRDPERGELLQQQPEVQHARRAAGTGSARRG